MSKRYSLRTSVLTFFFLGTLTTLLIVGSYLVLDYQSELQSSLKKSLMIVAEDLLHHEIINDEHNTKSERSFLDQYHKKTYSTLFDDLTLHVQKSKKVDEEKSYAVKKLDDSHYLVVSSGFALIDAKLRQFTFQLVLISFVSLFLLLLIFSYFLKKLFYPLECLVDFCKDTSAQKSSIPLCSGGSREVENLKNAIIDLLDANQVLCQQKQDIFKEAAHEIKSPIAILKARLSLFKQSDTIDKSTFVQESEADIKTISNKLRELLFLKEIEWDMQKQKETISMQEQCMMMQQAFKPILEKKGLSMVSNWEEDFSLSVHKEAMQKVMQAIFENIFMHTKNSSTITNYVDSKNRRLHIVNEMGAKSDETLFSSYIGSKMIARLADKLDYSYEVEEKDSKFYTTIVFNDVQNKCEI